MSGLIRQKPYPKLGNLVDEISPVGHWTLWDAKKHPDWPLLIAQTHLHEAYAPGDDHPLPYPYRADGAPDADAVVITGMPNWRRAVTCASA